MSLRWMDSFSTYNTSGLASRYSVTGGSINPTAGRYGGGAFVSTFLNQTFAKAFDNQSRWIIGFAYKTSSISSSSRPLILRDLTTSQVDIRFDALGRIQFTRNGTVLAMSTQQITGGSYYFVEVDATIHNTAGAFEVRVNGQTWLSATGVNTRNSPNNYANTVVLGTEGASSDRTVNICDLYICDATGSTNNSLLGDVRVDPLFPNAAGDLSDWVPNGAASGYNCVNEVSPDGDTTYISDGTVGDYETFKFGSLPSTPVTVFGVQTNMVARKDDAGTREIAPTIRVGSTNYDGATVSLNATYTPFPAIHETNPATGVSWDPSDLATGTFQAGVKVVS